MNSFSDTLAKSYSYHPAFKDVKNVLKIKDLSFFKKFNHAYTQIAAHQSKRVEPAKRHFENAKNSVCSLIQALQAETDDNFERLFLQELQEELLRTLEADFFFFGNRHKLDFWTRRVFKKHKRFLHELSKKRFFIDRLPSEIVEKILDLGKAHLEVFRKRALQGKLTREDLSFNSGPEAWEIKKLLHSQFDRIGVIDAVSEYMQQPFEVAGQAFELSVSQAQWWRNGFHGLARTPDTLYAHLDESIGVPKSIVYLTDVTIDNGPTGYYEGLYEELELNPLQEMVGRVLANIGSNQNSPLKSYYDKSYHQSMTSEKFRRHFMRLPSEMRFNSHFGWDIMPDSEAEIFMKTREKKMTGPAGTFIVFDGSRLLHRGGLVSQGERVALQVVFNPTKQEKIRKRIFRQYFS